MTSNRGIMHSPDRYSQAAARVAIVLAGAFLVILGLLHILEPEFDPSWRMISEYQIGRFGWMMTLAFFCWGGSVFALLAALGPSFQTSGGLIGRWWMIVIGVSLVGAGVFKTNAITDSTPSLANSLHTLCGAIVILSFPIAASLMNRNLRRNPSWASAHRRLLGATILVWLGLGAYFASIVVSNIINPSAGRVGPAVFLGWPNRFMVVTYASWLIVVSLSLSNVMKSRQIQTINH